MKTTKEERDVARRPCSQHGCLKCRLIADVDDATKWLRQQHEALAPNKKLPHSLCRVCDFLKEPSDD